MSFFYISPGLKQMFHTFHIPSPCEGSADNQSGHGTVKKPKAALRACVECKRRKIRCDQRTPCTHCLRRKVSNRCIYEEPQRVIPSKGVIESLSQSFEACRAVLCRLYPDHEWQALVPLSREGLLDLLGRPTITSERSHDHGIALPRSQGYPSTFASMSEHSFCGLEQVPELQTQWDEERRDGDAIPKEADDVNALSLSLSPQTSYLGVSSVKAALKVILKLQPVLLMPLTSATPRDDREPPSCFSHSSATTWSFRGQLLVNAYFKHFHIFVPMLNETAFRADFLEGKRMDGPWMALMNVVLAMGTIALKKSDDHSHVFHYNKAMEHITMQSLGSSHIETLQALILIGGFYLHYTSRPNMADAVIGAAIRMACAMGLHRELPKDLSDLHTADLRRRTWYSLFCIDIWATATLGRPSFAWQHAAINVELPQVQMNAEDGAQHAGVFPLVENIKLCRIAAKIQNLLAVSPFARSQDRHDLDLQLRNWYANLPWLLGTGEPCAETLYVIRCVMKWRCLNLRMLLHRPALLALAGGPSGCEAMPDEIVAVDSCRSVAAETIEHIGRTWKRNQVSGWHGAWFLYQAVMVPLVSIFWQPESASASEWKQQVDRVLELLDAMADWSPAAGRSREVIKRIYDASHQQPGREWSRHALLSVEQTVAATGGLPTEPSTHDNALQIMDPTAWLDWQTQWDMNGMLWDIHPGVEDSYRLGDGLTHFDPDNDGTVSDWLFGGM
ncbi:fungal-specific transcription factor [Coniochaeta sp. 2T2.1]|nr:fungal-specific transcription factor [Coniochaeta sp. 2T2.1]